MSALLGPETSLALFRWASALTVLALAYPSLTGRMARERGGTLRPSLRAGVAASVLLASYLLARLFTLPLAG